jgi:hypothetical protein
MFPFLSDLVGVHFSCSAKPDVEMDVVRSVAQWRLEQVTGRRSQARMEAAQQKKQKHHFRIQYGMMIGKLTSLYGPF